MQLEDKAASFHQLREEKENLVNKIQQLEQERNDVSRDLENKKLELLQLKEEAQKWKEKNAQLETQITKVFNKKLFYMILFYMQLFNSVCNCGRNLTFCLIVYTFCV